jgi:hypothetical protein
LPVSSWTNCTLSTRRLASSKTTTASSPGVRMRMTLFSVSVRTSNSALPVGCEVIIQSSTSGPAWIHI